MLTGQPLTSAQAERHSDSDTQKSVLNPAKPHRAAENGIDTIMNTKGSQNLKSLPRSASRFCKMTILSTCNILRLECCSSDRSKMPENRSFHSQQKDLVAFLFPIKFISCSDVYSVKLVYTGYPTCSLYHRGRLASCLTRLALPHAARICLSICLKYCIDEHSPRLQTHGDWCMLVSHQPSGASITQSGHLKLSFAYLVLSSIMSMPF